MKCFTEHKLIWGVVIGICVITAIVVPTTVILVGKNQSSQSDAVSNNSIEIPSNKTNNTLVLKGDWIDTTDWKIAKYSFGREYWTNTDDNIAKIKFPDGSMNPSFTKLGGFVFYATPSNLPSENAFMSYAVKFGDADFNWVKGGMLPGLWIGHRSAYDGNRPVNGASARVMWRESGDAEAYLYVGKQTQEFYRLPGYVYNDVYGESIGRGFVSFIAGEWNNVTMHIKLNTVGVTDGLLELSINNKTFTYKNMTWRNDDNEKINGVMMNSFFGGSDVSWATPTEQIVYFANFTVTT
jgi:hypothetical protein